MRMISSSPLSSQNFIEPPLRDLPLDLEEDPNIRCFLASRATRRGRGGSVMNAGEDPLEVSLA